MRKLMSTFVTLVLACATVMPAVAQKITPLGTGSGGSPHVKADATVHGAAITIEYGRPYLKGRPEAQLMPPGEPWRTGADQATTITSSKPLTFGNLKLAAGTTYTINTIPGDKEWQLLIGKLEKSGQWGIPYQPSLEVGRVPMTVAKTATPVEQVTISIDETPAGGTLRIEWGTVSASAPFKVG